MNLGTGVSSGGLTRRNEHGSPARAFDRGRLRRGNAFYGEHRSACATKKVPTRQFGGKVREVVWRVSCGCSASGWNIQAGVMLATARAGRGTVGTCGVETISAVSR